MDWRRMSLAGRVAYMGDRRDIYRVLVGKPDIKRTLGRPRCRWKDNIKNDHQEVVSGVWTRQGQVAELVNVVMNLPVTA
jgi:hypothetical protein